MGLGLAAEAGRVRICVRRAQRCEDGGVYRRRQTGSACIANCSDGPPRCFHISSLASHDCQLHCLQAAAEMMADPRRAPAQSGGSLYGSSAPLIGSAKMLPVCEMLKGVQGYLDLVYTVRPADQ